LVRDFSLVFPETVSWSSVVFWIHRSCEWVEGVEFFDVFTGKGLAEGTRSLAFRVAFRHPDRTLSDAEAQSLHETRFCAQKMPGFWLVLNLFSKRKRRGRSFNIMNLIWSIVLPSPHCRRSIS
jgi:hypothetical protein